MHDRWQKKNKRVSVRTGGAQAKGGHSAEVKVSADGKFVAFESSAKNLVGNDTNGRSDIFRRGPLY